MTSADPGRVTPEDLRDRLRDVADSLNAASAPARRSGFRLGLIGAGALVALAFWLGKRRGRLARTFVELRRY